MNKGYKELVDYVEEGKWQIFGTLTFRYDVDFRQAEKTLNTFWNIVDRKLFGNLSYRKNIRTKSICVLQTGKLNNNKHIHFVANTIEGVDVDDFISILKFLWINKIKTAGQHMRIEKVKNLRATSKYLLYEYGKLGTDTLATTSSNI